MFHKSWIELAVNINNYRFGHPINLRSDSNLLLIVFFFLVFGAKLNRLAAIWPWTELYVCLPARNQLTTRIRGCVQACLACLTTLTDCPFGWGGVFSGSEVVVAARLWPWPLLKRQSNPITTAACVFVCVCPCMNTPLSSHEALWRTFNVSGRSEEVKDFQELWAISKWC